MFSLINENRNTKYINATKHIFCKFFSQGLVVVVVVVVVVTSVLLLLEGWPMAELTTSWVLEH